MQPALQAPLPTQPSASPDRSKRRISVFTERSGASRCGAEATYCPILRHAVGYRNMEMSLQEGRRKREGAMKSCNRLVEVGRRQFLRVGRPRRWQRRRRHDPGTRRRHAGPGAHHLSEHQAGRRQGFEGRRCGADPIP